MNEVNEDTERALTVQFFAKLAILARERELHKQIICDFPGFEPYISYSSLTNQHARGINSKDIFELLFRNGFTTNVSDCENLLCFLDPKHDGNLFYDEFLQIILPNQNKDLRDYLVERSIMVEDSNNNSSLDRMLSIFFSNEFDIFKKITEHVRIFQLYRITPKKIVDSIKEHGLGIGVDGILMLFAEAGVKISRDEVKSGIKVVNPHDNVCSKEMLERLWGFIPEEKYYTKSPETQSTKSRMKIFTSEQKRFTPETLKHSLAPRKLFSEQKNKSMCSIEDKECIDQFLNHLEILISISSQFTRDRAKLSSLPFSINYLSKIINQGIGSKISSNDLLQFLNSSGQNNIKRADIEELFEWMKFGDRYLISQDALRFLILGNEQRLRKDNPNSRLSADCISLVVQIISQLINFAKEVRATQKTLIMEQIEPETIMLWLDIGNKGFIDCADCIQVLDKHSRFGCHASDARMFLKTVGDPLYGEINIDRLTHFFFN